MKITAKGKELEDFEALCGGQEKTYGKQSKPRYLEASMFDLMNWPVDEHTTDYKASSCLIKDKLNKSGNYYSLFFEGTHWKSENHDNFRGFEYSPEKGQLFVSNYNICLTTS